MSSVLAADLFCGAGGTSTGLEQACDQIGRRLKLSAVNHWQRAVETHAAIHPKAAHHCEDLTTLDPRKAVPGGKLDLLVASPECTHHSVARGGMPMNDQSRASAWCVLRWATALRVDRILIENVPEFETWGPIGSNGRPLPSRRGEIFRAFVKSLESSGYRVDWRVLNAADYGGATTRRRLFVQAALGKRPIRWPEPTHEPNPTEGLYGRRHRWRAAREIIDRSMAGRSIFGRKRPLSPNTLQRIEAGIKKFWGEYAEPFLVLLRRNGHGRSLDLPVPTLTAGGTHVGLVEPFLLTANHGTPEEQSHRRTHSLGDPTPTLATSKSLGLVEPFLMHITHRGGDRVRSVDDPLATVTTANRGEQALIEPFITTMNYTGSREHDERYSRSPGEPLPTITSQGNRFGLVEPFILPHRKFDRMDVDSLDRPIRTIDATNGGQHALCEPFFTPFYANGDADSIDDPLRTVTTRDRHGLCQPGVGGLDILFRMLQPHELSAAMGFPVGYRITGNRSEQVRQIGNAVEVNVARELCRAMLEAN